MVETVNRVRRAGATGTITVRADKGFWSGKTVQKLESMGAEWFIGVRRYPNVKRAIENIDKDDWVDIGYTPDGQAQVAETTITTKIDKEEHTLRVVVRRTRLTDRQHPPVADLVRLATPRVRHQQPCPRSGGSRQYVPPSCLCGTGHPRPQTPRRTGPLSIRAVLRQRRLDGRRGGGSQPVPVDQPPHRRNTEGKAHLRSHGPHPPFQPARKNRQPQPQTPPATTHPLAMGTHLPHRSQQHPHPATTLLNNPASNPNPLSGLHHPGCRIPQKPPTGPFPPRNPTDRPRPPSKEQNPPAKTPKTSPITPTTPTQTTRSVD